MPGGRVLPAVRVAPGNRYFETETNESFLMIGMNDSISWPGLAGLYGRRDVASAERYLEKVARHGVTILRVMLEYAQFDDWYFESSVGQFNPVMVRLWDDLIERCAALGLRLLLTPWDTFWMSRRWHRHPYNAANGGPAHAPAALLTDEATIQATINRLCFVIERWGGSGVICAWDLFNELHPHWGGTPAEQGEALGRISAAIREAEMRVSGVSRLQTISCFGPQPDPGYAHVIFEHPALDFATTHVYHIGGIDAPINTSEAPALMADWVRYGVRHAHGRPFTDTEHGPIHRFNDLKRSLALSFDDEYERHLMWAHLAAGGAGGGMRWPARNPHILTEGMLASLKSLADFTRLIDWRHFTPRKTDGRVDLNDARFAVTACADDTQAVIWLLRQPPADHRGRLPRRVPHVELAPTISGLADGLYEVTLWDTVRGCAQLTYTRTSVHGEITLTIPRIRNEVAIAVRRRDR